MSTLIDTDIIARADKKIAADMGNETVILDIESEDYFELNRTGARIWGLLEAPATLSSLSLKMAAAFAVESEVCRADIIEFIVEMESKGLATVTRS